MYGRSRNAVTDLRYQVQRHFFCMRASHCRIDRVRLVSATDRTRITLRVVTQERLWLTSRFPYECAFDSKHGGTQSQ